MTEQLFNGVTGVPAVGAVIGLRRNNPLSQKFPRRLSAAWEAARNELEVLAATALELGGRHALELALAEMNPAHAYGSSEKAI